MIDGFAFIFAYYLIVLRSSYFERPAFILSVELGNFGCSSLLLVIPYIAMLMILHGHFGILCFSFAIVFRFVSNVVLFVCFML